MLVHTDVVCSTVTGTLKPYRSKHLYGSPLNEYQVTRSISSSFPIKPLLVFNDTSNALRFTVCASRTHSALPFEQLVYVFQGNVWLTTTVVFGSAIVFVAAVVKHRDNLGVGNLIMGVFKCLVEQGDPFSFRQEDTKRVKLVIVGVLCASLLLSNAYKNENVFTMVLPRKRLSYETLSQLKQENYSFYTTTAAISLDIFENYWYAYNRSAFQRSPDSQLEDFVPSIEPGPAMRGLVFCSDTRDNANKGVRLELAVQSDVSRTEADRLLQGEQSDVISYLFNASNLHPDVFPQILSHIENVTKYPKQIQQHDAQQFVKNISSWYSSNEKQILLKELGACSKSAVIAPTLMAAEFKQNLRTSGIDVDIGQDVLASGLTGVDVLGVVSLAFMRRLWGMRESGITNWWQNYLDPFRVIPITSDHVVVSAPKISGNILVIFTVWAVGVLVSTLAFVFEQRTKYFNLIRLISHQLKRKSTHVTKL